MLLHNLENPEASLIVPNFTIFMYSTGSSCNSLLFGPILSSFLSPSVSLLPILFLGCQ